MLFQKIIKDAVVLGAMATAGIVGGLIAINHKELKKEKVSADNIAHDDDEEINFRDLNSEIVQDQVINDDDISLTGK